MTEHGIQLKWREFPWLWMAAIFVGAGVTLLWHMYCAVPYREPPVWDETDYMSGALLLMETCKTPSRLHTVLLDPAFFVSHRTLVGSIVALPLLWWRGVNNDTFFLASALTTILAGIAVALVARGLLQNRRARDMAAACALVFFLVAPMVVTCSSIFYSEAPAALGCMLALLAYLHARKTNTRLAWAMAGLALFATIYVRAERGVSFIGSMIAVYCIDELHLNGWRAAMRATIISGAWGALLSLVCLQWMATPSPASAAMLLLQIGLIVWIVVSLQLVAAFSREDYRSHLYGGLALVSLCLWFLYGENGEWFFRVLQSFSSANMANTAQGYFKYPILEKYVMRYCGSYVDCGIKILLTICGASLLIRRWPGLLVLFSIQIMQAATLRPEVGARYLYGLHTIVSIVAGAGAGRLLAAGMSYALKRQVRARAVLAIAIIAFLAILSAQLPHLHDRAWRAFRDFDVTYWVLYDREGALRQALEQMKMRIPRGSELVYSTGVPALEVSAVRHFSSMNKLHWSVHTYEDGLRHVPPASSAACYFVAFLFSERDGPYQRYRERSEYRNMRVHAERIACQNDKSETVSIGDGMYKLIIVPEHVTNM